MSISSGNAKWEGSIKEGHGSMKPTHATEAMFSLGSRFEGQQGSNPEELIGAALSGCFSMALAGALGAAGLTPTSIRTSADVQLDKDGAGFTITSIKLTTRASVPGVEAAKFAQIAEETKKNCPVSKALAGVKSITLDAALA